MNQRVYEMIFSDVYQCYFQKVVRKDRTAEELDTVIRWLTGYTQDELVKQLKKDVTIKEFFADAKINPKAELITGTICGYKIEEIKEPLMQKIRYMDKLVDELAQGKPMEKILRR